MSPRAKVGGDLGASTCEPMSVEKPLEERSENAIVLCPWQSFKNWPRAVALASPDLAWPRPARPSSRWPHCRVPPAGVSFLAAEAIVSSPNRVTRRRRRPERRRERREPGCPLPPPAGAIGRAATPPPAACPHL
jgi:hypothetical protein